ncbi:MAG: hypothetical protein K6A82_05305 [Prevotella sp.]|nr:hypothetical protein [Prevotella sp.]
MNKILRLSFVAALAAISSMSFAQSTVVTFSPTTDKYGTSTAGPVEITKDNVKMAITKGIANNNYAYRVYKGETLTISSTSNEILKIEIPCDNYGEGKYLADGFETTEGLVISGDKLNATWTGSSNSVALKATTHQVRPKSITVTLKDNVTAGINTVATEANEDAPLYNLAGQRVSKDYKGVVIQNGKKFINK